MTNEKGVVTTHPVDKENTLNLEILKKWSNFSKGHVTKGIEIVKIPDMKVQKGWNVP